MGSRITHVEYFLPEQVLSNDDLKNVFPSIDLGKIEKIGIHSRHIASDKETSLDLAYHAAIKLFDKIDKTKIDYLLLCTQTPDYFLPTSACILQDRLGLRKNIGALDFNLGCSGYVYGLSLAKGLIEGGIASNVLLLTGETYSKLLNEEDRGNRSIFGDAGSATIISKSEDNKIFNFELGTDGAGAENLIVKNGALKNKTDTAPKIKEYGSNNCYTDNDLYMNGPEIFHQANKFMLGYLRKKIKIPENKFYVNLETVGNTVSNTIPIALKDSIEKGHVKEGDKVLLCGFGVGYSMGATIIEL